MESFVRRVNDEWDGVARPPLRNQGRRSTPVVPRNQGRRSTPVVPVEKRRSLPQVFLPVSWLGGLWFFRRDDARRSSAVPQQRNCFYASIAIITALLCYCCCFSSTVIVAVSSTFTYIGSESVCSVSFTDTARGVLSTPSATMSDGGEEHVSQGSWQWEADTDWDRAHGGRGQEPQQEDDASHKSTDRRLMPRNAPKAPGYAGEQSNQAWRIYRRKAEIWMARASRVLPPEEIGMGLLAELSGDAFLVLDDVPVDTFARPNGGKILLDLLGHVFDEKPLIQLGSALEEFFEKHEILTRLVRILHVLAPGDQVKVSQQET